MCIFALLDRMLRHTKLIAFKEYRHCDPGLEERRQAVMHRDAAAGGNALARTPAAFHVPPGRIPPLSRRHPEAMGPGTAV